MSHMHGLPVVLQVVGPTDSLTGEMVPAAGKVICSAATYTFAGDFGPIGSKQGRRCGAHVSGLICCENG
jgi:hypothetical protein